MAQLNNRRRVRRKLNLPETTEETSQELDEQNENDERPHRQRTVGIKKTRRDCPQRPGTS